MSRPCLLFHREMLPQALQIEVRGRKCMALCVSFPVFT